MSAALPLAGKRGLVTGIANADSIAWGCAKAFRAMGAELAVTYLNDKARPHVEPLARQVDASLLMPLDLLREGELEAVFEPRNGAAWTSCCIPSPTPRAKTCMAASPTARAAAFSRPWMCRAGRSSAWPSWPSP